MAPRPSYTDYPRTILWLVRGGTFEGVEVEPFYLSKWPITNEQFRAFEPDYRPAEVSPGDRDTAVGIDWLQADAYCRWYAEVSRKPMRLPSEIEWEHACRGEDGLCRPWGDDPEAAEDWVWDARNWCGRLQPAERKRGNGYGLHGMLGGVWEWTAPPPGSAGGSDALSLRALRGGSYLLDRSELSCSTRRLVDPTLRADDVGFRVAKSFR